jgi:hypothetical protein
MSRQFATVTVLASALTFGGVWMMTGEEPDQPKALALASTPAQASSVYYSGCNAVRAAGAAPLHLGEPGYREEMDGDGDGIACEPHRGGGGSFDLQDEGGSFGGGRGRR